MKNTLIGTLFGLLVLLCGCAPLPPSPPTKTSFSAPLAVQLWSFRNDFAKNVPGTLQRVRELGFTQVELAGYYNLTAQQFKTELDRVGLKPISMHVGYDELQSQLDEIIRDAKLFGVTDVGTAWINSPFTKADCEKAITVFNQVGEKLAQNGLTFFYHTHGYEFVPNEGGQGTLFDLLMAKTDPKFVKLQLDTLHVIHPGQDPAALLRKFPGRFISVHLKDLRKDKAPDNTGEVKDEDGRPLGQGKVNWSEVLREAHQQGIQRYILEDETPTVWQAVPQSLLFLKTLRF